MDWDSLFGHIFLFASLSLREIPSIIKGHIWEEKGIIDAIRISPPRVNINLAKKQSIFHIPPFS